MTKGRRRLLPPAGQQCECNDRPEHHHHYEFDAAYEGGAGWWCCWDRSPWDHDWPNHGGRLSRVYWEKDGRMCYAWWCANCRSWLYEGDDDWEPWPTGDDGRFMPSVHCQRIPGLD